MRGFDLIVEQDPEDSEAAEIFVDGTIDGREYRFLLDTGAAVTSVRHDEYTARFDCVGKKAGSGLFGTYTDDLITVPTIRLGSISKRDFTLARIGKHNPQARNLIGMDLLGDYRCHFLFDEHRVLVGAGDESEQGCAFHDLFLDEARHPYVEIQFGALEATAVWDTGAGVTIADLHFIHEHPALFREAGYSNGTDSTGSTRRTPMFIMTTSVLGGHEFPPHRVAGVDLSLTNATIERPMDLILGYSTLSRANWLFDFPRRKWAISKSLDVR